MWNALNPFLINICLDADSLFIMVRTRGNQGRGTSSQGPPTSVSPPPSLELALILRSVEAINETLKGRQSTDVEVEPPPSEVGNPEASRDSEGGPPPRTSLENYRK
jgi:hypothetical protein